ncbi:cyclase-associated protein [Cystoisospora suis]|uniref:Cyclase-associated protein n=1 Tax=Cystoisospora suis TaxID=483139 RepID=A0A2C6KHY1_9APIC|nr:cyclase-associated protein [Cystoisospora suis]
MCRLFVAFGAVPGFNMNGFFSFHGKGAKAKGAPSPTPAASAPSAKTAPPPAAELLELQGDTWRVWNFVDKKDIVKLSEATMRQKVQIRDCKKVAIQIDSKVNSVIIDNCEELRLCVSSLISGAEFVNCRKVKFQVTGVCPSIAIDKCSGVDLFLSKDSKETEITTSKSGEMNVNFPKDGADGDWVELPIPEQFHHRIKDGSLDTRVSELYSR